MELVGKLVSNITSKIGILPSASKDVFIKFSDECIHDIKNKDRFNGLKGSTKMKRIESLFKYQLRVNNVQINSDVNHRGIKILWNNKLCPS